MPPLSLTLALVAITALAACTGAPASPSASPAAPAGSTAAATPTVTTSAAPSATPTAEPSAAASPSDMDHGSMGDDPIEVTIVDFAFEPADIEAAVGQTVRWTNEGGQPHNIRSEDASITSPIVLREPFEWLAEGDAGTTYNYVCGIHPAMTGTITIVE